MSDKDRMNICKQCEYFNDYLKTCRKCGCFLILKTKISFFHCPLGKW